MKPRDFFKSLKSKISMKKPSKDEMKKGSKKLFWIWIGYQTIKGSITMTFIWAPLIWMWIKSKS